MWEDSTVPGQTLWGWRQRYQQAPRWQALGVPQEKPRQQVRPKEAWPGLSVAEKGLVGGTG